MRLVIGNILICAGVLMLMIQVENWRHPPREFTAASIKQRLVHVIEIGPDKPPMSYTVKEPDE